MDWTDDGIVLSARKHGESSVILNLLTAERGRHAGLVRGGAGKRARGLYQPGNRVRATWRARLEDHLGSYTCELTGAVAAEWLDDPLRLAGLSAACAVAEAALPEREPHPELYYRLIALNAGLTADGWLAGYVRWERDLLTDMGFGLDFSECAGGGGTQDLIYVSPNSGRAVSAAAGEIYKEKLLPLPAFLIDDDDISGPVEHTAILDGLTLTGFFLVRHAFVHDRRGMPAARERLVDRIRRMNTISGV